MKNLVFDFDGVIGNTFDISVQAIAKFTLLSPEAGKKILLRDGMKNHSDNFLSGLVKDIYFARFLKFIENKKDLLFQERIAELENFSIQKAIITRSDSKVCKHILSEYQNLFEVILGRKEARTKTKGLEILINKYGFEKEKIIFITDTVGDILEISKTLKIEQIYGVTWGFHSRDLLKQYLPASQIIDNFGKINLG